VKTINKFLLYVHPDFTDVDAIDHIAVLASKTQTVVEVLHVIEDYPQGLQEWWNVSHPIRLYEALVAKRQHRIDHVVDRIKAAGVRHVKAKLRWGSDLYEVIREVTENNHELIITTSRPSRGVFKEVQDCFYAGLCRQCPCSVWVIKNQSQLPAQHILVALEIKNITLQSDSLNTKILRTAGWFAAAYGSDLHIAYTLSPSEIKHAAARCASIDRDSYAKELRSEIQQTCNSVLEESDLFLAAEHIHLLKRSSKTLIRQLVQQQSMSLILMGARTRNRLAELLKGNIVEKIVDDVDCAVLIVKPDKFISQLSHG